MTFRVEIAGGIAVGKTTLCNALKARGFSIISEDLAENHYLNRVYHNRGSRGFDIGMAFLLSKASAIETYAGHSPIAVVDYALIAEHAYNDVHLQNDDLVAHNIVRQAIDLRCQQIGEPNILIHLHCPVERQLANIKKRGRDFEQGHNAAYLQAINDGITEAIKVSINGNCKIISINTQDIDVGKPKFIAGLVRTILQAAVQRSAAAPSPSP